MSGPLERLRILDFSTLLPGPVATMILGDLGADVLRIESPHRPDLVRVMPPYRAGISVVHASINRNKKSLTLDLKHPASRGIIERFLNDYDIVIEQFRPGVMKRLGLDYEQLRTTRPDLIYVSITGYGQTSAYANKAGHDLNFMALSGALLANGRRDQGPMPYGIQVADLAGGAYHAVMGLLAAVIHRHHTGEGQYIDLSMTDAAFSMQALSNPAVLEGEAAPGLETGILNGGGFYDCYACSDGHYLAVAPLEPHFFVEFADVINRKDLVPFLAVTDPVQVSWLKQQIREELLKHPRSYWLELFRNKDCCVEPVLDARQAMDHPALRDREMIVDVPLPGTDEILTQVASPLHFSKTPASYVRAGSEPGFDSDQVLRQAGWSADEIAQFRTSGVLN